MQTHANSLIVQGHQITSRWIYGGHTVNEKKIESRSATSERFAREDIEDLHAAQALIMFQESPRMDGIRGGAFVELGMAIERNMLVIICGNPGHVFAALTKVNVFETFQQVLHYTRELAPVPDAAEGDGVECLDGCGQQTSIK